MFQRIYAKTPAADRNQVYNNLDLAFAIVSRLVELLFFFLVILRLGPYLYRTILVRIPNIGGYLIVVVILVILGSLLIGLIAVFRSNLDSAFGLDPRPLSRSMGEKILRWGLFAPYLILATALAFLSLQVFQVVFWAILYLLLIWLGLFVVAIIQGPRLPGADKLRDPTAGEIPSGLERYDFFFPKNKFIPRENYKVSTLFTKGLVPPYVAGKTLVIPEKALSSFTPDALKARILMALLYYVISARRNVLGFRTIGLALAVPSALVLLNSVGLWLGHNLLVPRDPALIGFLWLATWLAFWFSEFLTLFVIRQLDYRVSATVAALTLDAQGLFLSVEVMARYNLDPMEETPIRDIFRARPSPLTQLKHIRDTIKEMAAAAARRKSKKEDKEAQKSAQDEENGDL
ncbi:MAG: hypothetical protein LBE38_10125 [Deltaproteobacteria bacterium]|jgi:hypothetical protein|nr:hypothetical protein [Deltaproteobacteria bacterium]